VQEDETALTVWALWRYFEQTGDRKKLNRKWEGLVEPAAEFMHSYFDEESSLPRPSHDLWEEKRYVSTFTVASVYAGLEAAARIAGEIGKDGGRYRKRAEAIRKRGLRNLVLDDKKIYSRGTVDGEPLEEVSAPIYFLEKLGLVEPEDEIYRNTMLEVEKRLSVDTEVGGLARYSGDTYHSQTGDFEQVPGNPWIISTLWTAQHRMKQAESLEELEHAAERMHWSCENSLETGLLPEQVHPFTGEGLSVAPLTWSHTTFIDTALLYSWRKKELS
jgi:GH15 family glucan-1,4-alpha-glucosidase